MRSLFFLTAATVATYLGFLGWDQRKDVDPVTGDVSGPYQTWQVVGCGAVLALVVFEAGRRGLAWRAVLVVPIALTACFAVDAATDADADGLWPVGAALVALGSFAGAAAVAALGDHVGRSSRDGGRGGRGLRPRPAGPGSPGRA